MVALLQTHEPLEWHESQLLAFAGDDGPLLNLPHEVHLCAGCQLAFARCIGGRPFPRALRPDQNMRRSLGDGLGV